MKVDGSGSFDEGQPMACLKLDKASEQTLSLTDPGDKSKETAEDENVSLYETKYPLATVSGIKGQMSTAESGGKPLFEAVQREIKDGNAALEEKQNKCQVPPKPAPYSSLKKTNPAGSDSVGEMLMEKVNRPVVLKCYFLHLETVMFCAVRGIINILDERDFDLILCFNLQVIL